MASVMFTNGVGRLWPAGRHGPLRAAAAIAGLRSALPLRGTARAAASASSNQGATGTKERADSATDSGGRKHKDSHKSDGKSSEDKPKQSTDADIRNKVDQRLKYVQERSRQLVVERPQKELAPGQLHSEHDATRSKFHLEWQGSLPPRKGRGGPGPGPTNDGAMGQGPRYRFRIEEPVIVAKGQQAPVKAESYTDYTGLRFPTLETAENYDYFKDRGLNRIMERSYPIKVPGHRRLDPYFREYIHFLHALDPSRFSLARIAQRYRLREKTVAKVVQEWGTNRYLTRSGLTRLRDKQQTKESVILAKKEQMYGKWVGWDQLGDEDDAETDDEALGEYKGWRSTNDWVRRQNVEVEMMSAFPMRELRNPMPKRVDVDLVVDRQQHMKVINWIDPTDKVVF